MQVANRWTVYIVICADGSFYTGISKDLIARIARHNSGHGAKYTRTRTPVQLVYWESVLGHGNALRRERAIKKLSRADKQALVLRAGVMPDDGVT